MAINLPDLRAAVSAYITSNVTSSVSTPVADVPVAISPNEEFSFNVTATNAGSPNGVRLINVVYHLTISPSGTAQLKVPASPPARALLDPTSPTLAVGSFVSGMFLFPSDNSLDVGDSDTISGLKGKALALGSATISMHVHADPDPDFLFPKGGSNLNASKTVTVV